MLISVGLAWGQESVQGTLSPYNSRTLALAPTDIKGKPVAIDGIPSWTMNKQGVVSIAIAPNGMSCVITWVSGPDDVVITATADTKKGVPVSLKTVTFNISTLENEAVSLGPSIGNEFPDVALQRIRGDAALMAVIEPGSLPVKVFQWIIDGRPLGNPLEDPPAIVETIWDSREVANGVHVFHGAAADDQNTVGYSAPLPVNVVNP